MKIFSSSQNLVSNFNKIFKYFNPRTFFVTIWESAVFVEVLALLIPLALINIPIDTEIVNKIKIIFLILISLSSVKVLTICYTRAFRITSSSMPIISIRHKLSFLLQVATCGVLLMLSIKILKLHLRPELFTLFLLLATIKISSERLRLEFASPCLTLVVLWLLHAGLLLLSFLIWQEFILTPIVLLSISFAFLLTAYRGTMIFRYQNVPPNYILRLPGILYLSHAACQGILIILELVSPWFFLNFFLVPLIVKLSPSRNLSPTNTELDKFIKFSHIAFVLFLLIMLTSYIL